MQEEEYWFGGAEDERGDDAEGGEGGIKTACYAADAGEVVVDQGGGVVVEGFAEAGS